MPAFSGPKKRPSAGQRITPPTAVASAAPATANSTTATTSWETTLVNAQHAVPEDWIVQKADLANGEVVDRRILPDLQSMLDAARDTNLTVGVADGYRSVQEQQALRTAADKESVTGRASQPNHFRWVGREHARATHEHHQVLEEYAGR